MPRQWLLRYSLCILLHFTDLYQLFRYPIVEAVEVGQRVHYGVYLDVYRSIDGAFVCFCFDPHDDRALKGT